MTHEDFMNIAIDLARKNVASGRQPYGAIVVRAGKVIGVSKNNGPIIHAELAAINDAFENIGQYWMGDCVLYTTCKLCDSCLGAARHVGIKEIYYAMDEDDVRPMGSRTMDIIFPKSHDTKEIKIPNKEIVKIVKDFYDTNEF